MDRNRMLLIGGAIVVVLVIAYMILAWVEHRCRASIGGCKGGSRVVELRSMITCLMCGYRSREMMPTDADTCMCVSSVGWR
jgi:hypothetical protein